MHRNTLPLKHPLTGTPFRPVGYRRNGRPIWPILGGSEPAGEGAGGNGGGSGSGNTSGGSTTGGEGGGGDGGPVTNPADPNFFPPNTAVAEMTPVQQAAYWRNQSKVQQSRVPANLTELQQKASQYDQLVASTRSEAEVAIDEALEMGRAEGRAEVQAQAAQEFLRGQLSQGRTDEQVDALMRGINAGGFVGQDGKIDYTGLRAFATTLGGATGGGDPDIGNGRRGGAGKPSVARGRSLYQERHPQKSGASS